MKKRPGIGIPIPGFWLQFPLEKAVAVAIAVQNAPAPQLQPGFGAALRVELHQLEPVGGDIGKERDEVVLGHAVRHS